MKRSALVPLVLCLVACHKAQDLPPPVYRTPELPAWEAPPAPEDPLDAAELEGEWVPDEGDAVPVGDEGAENEVENPAGTEPDAMDPAAADPAAADPPAGAPEPADPATPPGEASGGRPAGAPKPAPASR